MKIFFCINDEVAKKLLRNIFLICSFRSLTIASLNLIHLVDNEIALMRCEDLHATCYMLLSLNYRVCIHVEYLEV